MYLRIIWGRVKSGERDGYEEAYKKGIAMTHGTPGLKGRWLTRDLDDPDAGYSITLWEDEKSMRDYMASSVFKEKIMPMVQPFFVDQYKITHCEVHASDDLPG